MGAGETQQPGDGFAGLESERTSSRPFHMKPVINEFNRDLIFALIIEDAVTRLTPSPSTFAKSVGRAPQHSVTSQPELRAHSQFIRAPPRFMADDSAAT